MPPRIEESTKEERQAYIRHHFACKADCENCGVCKIYHGISPEFVYQTYIEGTESFQTIAAKYH